jgi:hypothetical protein
MVNSSASELEIGRSCSCGPATLTDCWFADHPDCRPRVRPYEPGEFWPQQLLVEITDVKVRLLPNGMMLRVALLGARAAVDLRPGSGRARRPPAGARRASQALTSPAQASQMLSCWQPRRCW